MRYLKRFNESAKEDFQYSDRDITNKYHCAKGWVRYTDLHKDSYIDIEKYFDITWDHLGWILEDFVNEFDLLYRCSINNNWLSTSEELFADNKYGPVDGIKIDLVPVNKSDRRIYDMMYKKDILSDMLKDIDKKLEDFWLTIKSDGSIIVPNMTGEMDDWNLFTTTSQITLKIKRK